MYWQLVAKPSLSFDNVGGRAAVNIALKVRGSTPPPCTEKESSSHSYFACYINPIKHYRKNQQGNIIPDARLKNTS